MSWTVYRHITPSGKSYIGITSKKPEERWRNGEGYNQKGQQCFYNAIEKYKWENIQHIIVSTDLTEKEAKWLENYLICYYRTFVGFKDDCKGYNCTLGGDGVCGITSMKGKHLTEEHKRKIGEANKGRPHTEEEKKILSEANKGEKNPNYGRPHTEEHNNKIRESMKGKNKGKHHDEETKKRISKSMKGKPCNTKGMHRVYHEDGTFHMER